MMLFVEGVEQSKLLRPVGRVVHGVEVEGPRDGRFRDFGNGS